ncbi:hypothetical protein HJFPF1_01134 [Paramyrothecium foliicola]|nr:hypothetical protein HJFPF1_01134 [Paramyrothecium foliicola]
MPSHSRDLPAEDSWRVVDGEHDSFDTSILPSIVSFSDEDAILSGQPSSALPSQLSSGDQASQDSIRDFARHREDDNVILREPFRPTMSLASTSARAVSGGARRRQRIIEEEPSQVQEESEEERDEAGRGDGSEQVPGFRRKSSAEQTVGASSRSPVTSLLRVLATLIALLTVAYLGPALFILYHNFKTYPRALAVIPICRMPLVPVERIAECHSPENSVSARTQSSCIDFENFSAAHSTLEGVPLRQRDLIGLTSDSLLADTTFNQLRSLVEENSVAHKSMVLHAFDSYRLVSEEILNGVRGLDISVETAVNEAIRLAETSVVLVQSSDESQRRSPALHLGSLDWLFSPFEIPEERIREHNIRQRYIQHAEHLTGAVSNLLDSGTQLIHPLSIASADIRTIIRLGPGPADRTLPPQGQLGWNQWTLLAVKSAQLRLVHQGMQVLNSLLAKHELAKAKLELLVDDLQILKQDLDSILKEPKSLDVPEARDDSCASAEDQIEQLRGAAARLQDTLDSPPMTLT